MLLEGIAIRGDVRARQEHLVPDRDRGAALAFPELEELADPSSSGPEEWLTVEQVSTQLQVSQRSVYRALRDGRLSAVKVGAQWRVRREELADWARPASAGQPLATSKANLRAGRSLGECGLPGVKRTVLRSAAIAFAIACLAAAAGAGANVLSPAPPMGWDSW